MISLDKNGAGAPTMDGREAPKPSWPLRFNVDNKYSSSWVEDYAPLEAASRLQNNETLPEHPI